MGSTFAFRRYTILCIDRIEHISHLRNSLSSSAYIGIDVKRIALYLVILTNHIALRHLRMTSLCAPKDKAIQTKYTNVFYVTLITGWGAIL